MIHALLPTYGEDLRYYYYVALKWEFIKSLAPFDRWEN